MQERISKIGRALSLVDWVGYLRKYALSYWSNESGPKLFHAREHKLVYFTISVGSRRGGRFQLNKLLNVTNSTL